MVSGSAEPLFWTKLQVESLKELPSTQTAYCGYDNYNQVPIQGNFEATIQVYSLFGLPWTKIRLDCRGEGRVYRLPGGLFELVTELV